MSDIMFFLRIMFFTVVAVLLMQVRWGEVTIEDHAMDFMTSSTVAKPIDDVASGAVRFIRNTWTKVTSSINTNFTNALRSENQPGKRSLGFQLERNKDVVNRQMSSAQKMISKAKSKFIDETNLPGDPSRASSSDDEELIEK